jgi:orotate phosphoribosyltransferase
METYQLTFDRNTNNPIPTEHEFIMYATENGQLLFPVNGTTLKSGRLSPYFFNAGNFNDGLEMWELGHLYAMKLVTAYPDMDENFILFGPPYKGIALANATAMVLYHKYKIRVGITSSRKEAKDHGEGGILMGADMSDCEVIIIDDVITDGASKRDAVKLVQEAGGEVVGGIIAFDRQERGKESAASGAEEFQKEFGVPMHSIANFKNLLEVFATYPGPSGELYESIRMSLMKYRDCYGIAGV